jgi:hypothetical protein
MLQDHSRVEIVHMKPVVLQYILDETVPNPKTDKQLCDPCDVCDTRIDTPTKKLGDELGGENLVFGEKNNVGVSGSGSHTSHTSHDKPRYIPGSKEGNGSMFECYHIGCEFQTYNKLEYEKHGAQKHHKNPLLYPAKAEIEKYGLNPQGKEWEV